jgi:hypothetical protein
MALGNVMCVPGCATSLALGQDRAGEFERMPMMVTMTPMER